MAKDILKGFTIYTKIPPYSPHLRYYPEVDQWRSVLYEDKRECINAIQTRDAMSMLRGYEAKKKNKEVKK